MVLVDKRILFGGLVMIITGMLIAAAFAQPPAGKSGMTDDEIIDLLISEDEHGAYQMLSGILVGTGFLLVLISFGARRKKKDTAKRKEKKPAE